MEETLLEELQARYAPVVRHVMQADLADQVLRDQARPALAGALATAEQLGAQPADLLATAAGQRELASAKSAAQVLTFRVEQHQVPAQAAMPRTPTAADLAATNYPTPLAAARPGTEDLHPQDLALLGAAPELGREADTERTAARNPAGTADDVSTPHVDERRQGLNEARTHAGHAGADQATATGLLGQADTSRTPAADGAPATAAQSYPTPINQVTTTPATPKTAPAAPATRAATGKAPTARRQR